MQRNPPHFGIRRQQRAARQWKLHHPWLWFFGSVGLLAAWYTTPVSDWITEIVLLEVPIEADLELDQQAPRKLRLKSYDPYWSSRIDRAGDALLSALQTRRSASDFSRNARYYQWDYGILPNENSINAYCLPGGTIRVTQALLDTLQPTAGELAALLGHEMGHVLSRHAQKRMLSQELLQAVASMLLLDNGRDNSRYQRRQRTPLAQALGETLLKATDWLGQQKFSRRDEYQADGVAWDLLVASDVYNPQSLQSLLKKLSSLEEGRQKDSSSNSMLLLQEQVEAWSRTHPATTDRINALEEKWQSLPRTEKRQFRKKAT